MTAETKTCRECGETKSIGQYREHRHRNTPGTHTICRTCENVRRREDARRTRAAAKPAEKLAAFLVAPEAWMGQAACKNMPTDMFFPTQGATAQIPAVLAICETCPVQADCLAYAEKAGIASGIWGGTTGNERARRRRDRNRQQQKGEAA